MDIAGKAAIVTGSATGIGRATALALAAGGVAVAVNYTKSRDEAEDTAALCRKAGVKAVAVAADVALDADCRRLVAEATDAFGRLDVLVNSAGTTKFVRADDLDGLAAEDFQRIYAVNAVGPFQMARAAATHLKARGNGAIVNVSSTAAIFGSGSSIAYAMSKAALNNLTVALARTLAPEVRVNAVCPGFVQSRWHLRNLDAAQYDAHVREWRERSPLRKAATPEEVAGVVLGLIAGPDLVTGQAIVCDAGANMAGRRR